MSTMPFNQSRSPARIAAGTVRRRFLTCLGLLCVTDCLERSRLRLEAAEERSTTPDLPAAKAARTRLAEALHREDLQAIQEAEAAFRRALGSGCGTPESIETSWPVGSPAPRPVPADFQKLSRAMGSLASGSKRARECQMELRNAGYLASGLLALAETGVADAPACRHQAAMELDYLLEKQCPEGFFPYPVNPAAPDHLKALAAKAARQHPEKVVGGFLHLDADGTQFDTACCGVAMVDGFRCLKDQRYLAAARKTADWALTKPLSANWNYNAFLAWLLVRVHEAAPDSRYLNRALHITRLGVLPGQLETGQWSDPHNAKRVYHWILVRGLLAVLRVIPPAHPEKQEIEKRTRLAIQVRVDETLREGGAREALAAVALAEAVDQLGPNRRWELALEQTGSVNPYSAGILAARVTRRHPTARPRPATSENAPNHDWPAAK